MMSSEPLMATASTTTSDDTVLSRFIVIGVFIFLCVACTTSTTASNSQLPCKVFSIDQLDCRGRRLTWIPADLSPTVALTSANFSDNKISILTKDDFSTQKDLVCLDLSRNVLANITGAPFDEMVSLTYLSLSNNRLPFLNADSFNGLTNLKSLDLSYNELSMLPDVIFQDLVGLNILSLGFNQFTEAPGKALSSLHALRSLVITLIELKGTVFDSHFQHLKNLKKITLSSTSPNLTIPNDVFSNLFVIPITDLVVDAPNVYRVEDRVFEPLRNLSGLRIDGVGFGVFNALASLNDSAVETLQLSGKRNSSMKSQGDLSANALAALENVPSLTSLSISHFGLEDIEGEAFVWVPSLRKLDLSWNLLNALYEDVFVGMPFLEELDLSHNQLDEPYDALEILGPSLHVLNLANNYYITGEWLPEVLQAVPHLTHLNLEWNNIDYLYEPYSPADVANLTELNLSGNRFDSLPPWGWTSPFPSLTTLQYTNINIELLIDNTEFAVLAPKLENVEFRSTFYAVMSIHSCTNLRQIDLSHGDITSESFHKEWLQMDFPALQGLTLSHNRLTYLNDSTFARSPQINVLDLSYNTIEMIPSGTFDHLNQLQYLNLQENRIKTVHGTIDLVITLLSLQDLNVAYNNIAEIPYSFFRSLSDTRVNLTSASSKRSTLLKLDLSWNPYLCSCSLQPIQDWIQHDVVILVESFPDYVCSAPNATQGMVITEVPLRNCQPRHPLRIGVYVAVGVAVLFVTCLTIFLCVKYHWHLRYVHFLIFKSNKIPPPTGRSAGDEGAYSRYDAFVSYNEKDETWVFEELMPNMEDSPSAPRREDPDKFRLCIGARDFVLGGCILEAILEGVGQSHKTLMVLSPNFVESEWCYYELQSAQLSLFHEGRDVLVLVLLEEIPDGKLPILLRRILCTKTCLKWPHDKIGQDLFWRRLKEELKKPSLVNRRHET